MVHNRCTAAEMEQIGELFTSWGLPPERWDDYMAEISGMIAMALDDYFASLRAGARLLPNVKATVAKSSEGTKG